MKKNFFKITLIASLLLHLLGSVTLYNFASPRRSLVPRQRTEVELLTPEQLLAQMKKPPEPLGQIVDQNEKAVNDEVPVDSKFLSRHNQKVQRETRAALNGKFQNAQTAAGAPIIAAPGALAKADAQKDKSAPEEKIAERKPRKLSQDARVAAHSGGEAMLPSLDALKPKFNQYAPSAPQQAQGGGAGAQASATDDHLKDVPTGLQTMLSTREFVYFSYYNRIKGKLRQYWEPKIKEKMERVIREGRTIASTADKITKIVILLDKHGTLVRVQIVGASGLHDLDDAAVEAFRAAAPFPNPPQGIVEADGLIRIRWDFILEASAGPVWGQAFASRGEDRS